MAEGANAGASASASRASARASDEADRGRPYYDKLRRELKQSIEEKQRLDLNLGIIEKDIAEKEEEYLEQTAAAGNIIKGFDNYVKASTSATTNSTGPGTSTRRKGGISEQDKIFSRSSTSWALPENPSDSAPLTINPSAANAARLKSAVDTARTESMLGSARDTPTSQGTGATKASKSKKKGAVAKEKEEPDADEERPYKRGKVSWGRD